MTYEVPLAPTELESFVERLTPLVDDTIEKLGDASFREDPIAGKKYSRATSIMSSAYKRHGQILDHALLERLKDCSRLRVWAEPDFRLSYESLQELQSGKSSSQLMRTQLPYGDKERSISFDLVVYDRDKLDLRCYNVKRGNGAYDGGKRKIIQAELTRAHMLLTDYGRAVGISARNSHAHVVFYYGVMSLPSPWSIAGNELDAHFDFPVHAAIEAVNRYFIDRLHRLVELE